MSALLAVYQVTGERREALLSLARDSGPWWFADLASQRGTLAQYEKEVTKTIAFGSTLVLGQKRSVAYIDEAVLRRQVGGPRAMTHQLRHLVSIAERPTVELRVIPFAAGAYPGGDYVLLEFGSTRPLAYSKHRGTGLFLHRRCDVAP
ncbi:Scr1 family TA system antitoxin-like transcriptional regulator [Amycolatopsis sp. WAC 04169]|uniref:Scr1 family TA system antitoxin-like transcriptional regulator n=1 Tax=Amycolatopsis sp. WAC 04169 TaxID=2203197 RepID=UPI001F3C7F64|nr:Scr1 family TA system antitoxin-like transcriptional regulator [Amycolatopsis sp. WAC 04169]